MPRHCYVKVTWLTHPSCAATGKKLLSKMQMLPVEHEAPSVIHLLRKSKRRILRSTSINIFIKSIFFE
jgi:hypothetical protein